MTEIIIFGTGSSAASFKANIDPGRTKVVAYLDNQTAKQGTEIDGIPVFAPSEVIGLAYDYIVIASQFTQPIFQQLIELGVRQERILPMYPGEYTHRLYNHYQQSLKQLYRTNREFNDKAQVTLVSMNRSGCNARALYEHMPNWVSEQYDVKLQEGTAERIRADCVVTTHRNITLQGSAINVELWHGFPLKAMGRMHHHSDDSASTENWLRVHGTASYSQLYSTLIHACFPVPSESLRITGMPRTDWLYQEHGRDRLEKIIGRSTKGMKIIMYMPTFRRFPTRDREEGERRWNNLFDYEKWETERFTDFLRKRNILLMVKLHAFEEQLSKNLIMPDSNVVLLTQQMLDDRNKDLYEILSGVDVLITDYSSVYFDFLLLDRPILFTPTDLEQYRSTRGLLLEPYEWWTPGDKVLSQKELQSAIELALDAPERYKHERKMVRDLVHYYQDGQSSERVWRMIDRLMKARM